tara:strand:+ start:3061 stop:3672 length:612 start_codon:yes stop_codon:yes gene_type:complete
MNFQINKNKTVDDFKNYIKKFEKPEDDYNPSNAKKLQTPSNYYVLDRIRSLYQWVLKNSILDLRHSYIHNDDEFKQLKGDIENYIRNKIRSRSDGLIYMKVKDVTFDGNQDQYKDYLVKNKTKLFSLVRKIVDDLNGFLNGEAEVDKNKPVLNDDHIREEVVEEEPVIEEEAPPVVEEDKQIFIEVSLSLKGLMEEISNETSD